jgi:hypothetical protein
MDIQQHLLDRVTDIGDGQARTEQKVDDLVAQIGRFLPYVKGIDDRVTVIEKDQAVAKWVIGAVSGVGGTGLTLVMVWIASKFGIHLPL